MQHSQSFIKVKTLIFFCFLVCLCSFSFGQTSVEVKKTDTLSKPQTIKPFSPKIRVGAQVGYGYRNAYLTQSTYYSTKERKLMPVSNSMKNHLLKLNHNISYGVDISYFIKNYIGFGIRYNGVNAQASSEEILFLFEDDSYVRSSLSEKIGIQYIGAFLATRYFLKPNNHCFFVNIGAGANIYLNNLSVQSKKHTLTDISAGFAAEFGYDFFVTKNFAIGLQASMFFGSLKYFSYIIDNGNITLGKSIRQPRRVNLNHIDISLGFRFYK